MAFNPKDHLINLRGKDYLEVKHRLEWFRDVHPAGSIVTEMLSVDPLVFKSTVIDADGRILATGHGSANAGGKSVVWSGREVEKAETAAQGRALAAAGFGTQFTDDFNDAENDHLADSPQERKVAPPAEAEPHWTTVKARTDKFFDWAVNDRSLSMGDVFTALGVSRVEDYAGTPDAAMRAINDYINANLNRGSNYTQEDS